VFFRVPFRLPIAECLLLTTVATALFVAALLAVNEELMGDPIQFGKLELVAIRGVGTVLRDANGKHVAIWVQSESEGRGRWVPIIRD
jgi:hypothetical protein